MSAKKPEREPNHPLYCPDCGSERRSSKGYRKEGGRRIPRWVCLDCGRFYTNRTGIRDVKELLGRKPRQGKNTGKPSNQAGAAKILPKGEQVEVDVEQYTVEQRLRQENSNLKRMVKELSQEAIDTVNLRKLIHGVAEVEMQVPTWATDRKIDLQHGTPTLFLSDLHWGEKVYPAQVNHTNEFNLKIAHERLQRVFGATVNILRDHMRGEYAGIVVPLGGDMVSGTIHDELREHQDAHVSECIADLHSHLIAGIDMLEQEFGSVFVPCVVGNHGRFDRKPRAKGAVKDNFEWILYHFLAAHYADNANVVVAVSESLDYLYRIHNTTYLLTHGDQFRGGTGISGPVLPWSLGDHRKRKRQDAIDQPYDCMIFGHWHQMFWGGGTFICNGSLKGYDEYAFRMNFPFQRPIQGLWLTHPTKGINYQIPIYADRDSDKRSVEWISVMKQAA